MNLVLLKGNIGKGPEFTYSQGNLEICRFSLATNRRKKEGDKYVDDTTWHNITAFGKTAKFIDKYFSTGDPILIRGRIENRKYEKDGETKYYSGVIVEEAEFCSKRGESKPPKQDNDYGSKASYDDDSDFDDGIPF